MDAEHDALQERPDVSVFWQPGCSSCLKVKEFVQELGIEFESINVLDRSRQDIDSILDGLMESGIRSIPAVRKGSRYVYAQSLEDVADLLGVERDHKRLPNEVLFERWKQILAVGRRVVGKFSDEDLAERVIPGRERPVKHLAIHSFQIAQAFMKQIDEGETEISVIYNHVDPAIVTGSDLLLFIDDRIAQVHAWIASGKPASMARRIPTFYGEQESSQVLERAVWHSGQHIRQLDIVAAGRLGAELEAPAGIFDGLPMPKRLWA